LFALTHFLSTQPDTIIHSIIFQGEKLMGCAEKVVLAYSGTVDISVCIAYLKADEEIDWIKAIAHTPTEPESV
jgi:hypothetical protein